MKHIVCPSPLKCECGLECVDRLSSPGIPVELVGTNLGDHDLDLVMSGYCFCESIQVFKVVIKNHEIVTTLLPE